jgi:hypothetical protein
MNSNAPTALAGKLARAVDVLKVATARVDHVDTMKLIPVSKLR